MAYFAYILVFVVIAISPPKMNDFVWKKKTKPDQSSKNLQMLAFTEYLSPLESDGTVKTLLIQGF